MAGTTRQPHCHSQQEKPEKDPVHVPPSLVILIGNIQAAGVGWNCTATSTVAFGELDWTPGNMIQAEDRLYGLKRGKKGVPVTAFYLIGKDTIEVDLARLIQRKAKILDATLDGAKQDTSIDIYDQLARILRSQANALSSRDV